MHFVQVVFFLTFVAFVSRCDSGKETLRKRSKQGYAYCKPKSLVKYRLTVDTHWSKQTFPKMYPTYRPPAQWSPLVGRTHGPEHHMWAIGANATQGVKLFAEQGVHTVLNTEFAQGYNGVLDSFVAPPIDSGVGQTSCLIVLDGHHSKVHQLVDGCCHILLMTGSGTSSSDQENFFLKKSKHFIGVGGLALNAVLSFMMKIIPSPDWFIGVSSLDLCARGRWKTSLHVDLHPYDAGTDQGLTFSSPNWPSIPAEPVSQITSSFPTHPASSFLYPEYKALPRLAFLSLDLLTEYRQRRRFETVRNNNRTVTNKNSAVQIRDDDLSISNAAANNRVLKQAYPVIKGKTSRSTNNTSGSSKATKQMFVTIDRYHSINADENAQHGENSSVDCQVGQWAEWGPCSRTCGLGERERSRKVSIYPKNGGTNCPLLRERDVCGSMRNCQIARFTFLEQNAKKRLRSGQSSLRRDRTTSSR